MTEKPVGSVGAGAPQTTSTRYEAFINANQSTPDALATLANEYQNLRDIMRADAGQKLVDPVTQRAVSDTYIEREVNSELFRQSTIDTLQLQVSDARAGSMDRGVVKSYLQQRGYQAQPAYTPPITDDLTWGAWRSNVGAYRSLIGGRVR